VRAYHFTNQYLSGIHPGIQAGHSMGHMWLRYVHRERIKELIEFTNIHGTWIVLNGGDSQVLENQIAQLFLSDENPYLWSFFREPGLNNAVSSISIIIPERLYDKASDAAGIGAVADPNYANDWYTPWELKFLAYRVSSPLAR
jgi:hypothetical protein